MNGRLLLLSGTCGWLGTTLWLSTRSWFAQIRLQERLSPYQPGSRPRPTTAGRGIGGMAGISGVIGPVLVDVGDRLDRVVGAGAGRGALASRLEQAGHTEGPDSFRYRQLVHVVWALLAAGALAALTQTPPPLTALLVLGSPVLVALVDEHILDRAIVARRRLLSLELPVVAEQLGMLLSAGYSLHGAMHRLAERGSGVCCAGLRGVLGRVRHGMGDTEALREWAASVAHPGLDRIVSVLCLDREAGDLGRLISQEARAVRRDHHRELLENIERRGQQVWIPVTLAALVPGAILVAVPFLEALRAFGGSP